MSPIAAEDEKVVFLAGNITVFHRTSISNQSPISGEKWKKGSSITFSKIRNLCLIRVSA